MDDMGANHGSKVVRWGLARIVHELGWLASAALTTLCYLIAIGVCFPSFIGSSPQLGRVSEQRKQPKYLVCLLAILVSSHTASYKI